MLTPSQAERFGFSHHARQRLTLMGLGEAEVLIVLGSPAQDYCTRDDRRMAQGYTPSGRKIGVVYSPTNHRVITVVPWTERVYTRREGNAGE